MFASINKQLRPIMIDGEPWFVAADVCRILGIHVKSDRRVNATIAFGKVDLNEKRLYPIKPHSDLRKLQKDKPTLCVSESGLNKLIMRSDKPEAKTFQNSVTQEVLPAIRRTGG